MSATNHLRIMPVLELPEVRFKKVVTDTVVGSGDKAQRKIDILVRTIEQYESDICIGAFGKHADKLDELQIKPNDKLRVKFTIKSSESSKGGYYFTNANMIGIEVLERAEQFGNVEPQNDWTDNIQQDLIPKYDDLPF